MATSIYGKFTPKDSAIMKLATYSLPRLNVSRTAFVIGDYVIDLNSSSRYYTSSYGDQELRNTEYSNFHAPTEMHALIQGGNHSMSHLDEVFKHFSRLNGDEMEKLRKESDFVHKLDEVKIRAPLRPNKIIHTAGNFREHAKEGSAADWPFPIPEWISFLKNPDSVIGHDDIVEKPDFTNQLDHELELAIIIGKKMKNVDEEDAKKGIFGFTVFNDITARDLQREEMKNGLLNIAKNLDTFAPLGPVLVPYKYVKDPHKLTMELRVNGDPRQQGSTSKLSVKIEKIVSKYSWVTLNPGDMISTGTISGVAAFRKPDPTPFFLKDKDVLECEIEGIGLMRTGVKNA
ncbi:MAG: fumarylacetoacetate hydrolase family protein [Candidatus Thermoplasmatota archaeon]|nr:fumarylacetoacetate hydrolase family protein [Candidatus Thermoplasmatota archaeon]MDA8144037.1 fumarylacetoacetate hydrolase family protein [Thermoplasmatales archaeon]